MPATLFRPELIAPSAYIAAGARIVGNVTLGAHSSVWFNAVLRGDTAPITIGSGTNIQDLACLHADPGFPCQLGARVTVGHAAIVHGAIVEDDVLIGMRAVVMNGARIGRGSLIGVGAVVLEGMQIPAGSVVVGLPGKIKRAVTAADEARIHHAAAHYIAACQRALGP